MRRLPASTPGSRMTLQSQIDTLITIFGGSGFLGRHLVRALAKRHYRIRVAVRRPDLANHLQPLGRVGQIHAVQANVRHPGSVGAAVRDADIVINLVGILFERGRQRFDAVHREEEGVARRLAGDELSGYARGTKHGRDDGGIPLWTLRKGVHQAAHTMRT